MPMMFGYGGYGLWGIAMMLLSVAVFGFIIYWAVFAGVRNAMKNTPGERKPEP